MPTAPIATCFTSNAGWHTDQGPRVGGVKFLAHLQRRTVGTGALRVVPGSHDPAFAERVRGFWSRDPALQGFEGWPVPCVVLETEPGDVIAFDVHLYHSSAGGDQRLAWTIEYLPWPGLGDPERLRLVCDLVVDTVDPGRRHRRLRPSGLRSPALADLARVGSRHPIGPVPAGRG